jgi:hypothetical protein
MGAVQRAPWFAEVRRLQHQRQGRANTIGAASAAAAAAAAAAAVAVATKKGRRRNTFSISSDDGPTPAAAVAVVQPPLHGGMADPMLRPMFRGEPVGADGVNPLG